MSNIASRIFTFILCILSSSHAIADRYGIYDNQDTGAGSLSALLIIGLIITPIIYYIFLQVKKYSAAKKPKPVEIDNKLPKLWNPRTAFILSFFFTLAFGSFVIRKNWISLGKEAEAKKATAWIFATIFMIIFLKFGMSSVIPEPIMLLMLQLTFGLIFLILWYQKVVQKQEKYIAKVLNNNYQKKHWVVPIAITFPVFLVLAVTINFISETKLKQNTYQTPQATHDVSWGKNDQVASDLTSNENATLATNQSNQPQNDTQHLSNPSRESPVSSQNIQEQVVGSQQTEQTQVITAKNEATKRHYAAIYAAHPDADQIAQSQEFHDWIEQQGLRSYYENVIQNGSTDQVIDMFSRYKAYKKQLKPWEMDWGKNDPIVSNSSTYN